MNLLKLPSREDMNSEATEIPNEYILKYGHLGASVIVALKFGIENQPIYLVEGDIVEGYGEVNITESGDHFIRITNKELGKACFLNERQIRYATEKLVKEGVIGRFKISHVNCYYFLEQDKFIKHTNVVNIKE